MKKNRFIKTKRRQHLIRLKAVFLVIALFSIWFGASLEVFPKDPFAKIPLLLKHKSFVEFDNFRPRFEEIENGRYITRFENGITVTYTLNHKIQDRVAAYLKRYKVPYGAFVAIDPKTGEILALVDYSSREPNHSGLLFNASYPAASIFKLVTAAAAIEQKEISPDLNIPYRGKFNRLKPTLWEDHPTEDKLEMSFSDAFAESNNVVFAKIAHRWLDISTLLDYGERFYFNQPIPFEYPVQASHMEIPSAEGALEKTAAGFGKVGLSPLHAALIGAAIANNGVMMRPCMVTSVADKNSNILYSCIPSILKRTISGETAGVLKEMMRNTVLNGTVKDIFQTSQLERSLRPIKIGGKTGSLSGKNPRGRYTWFVAIAPLDNPDIVVAAMIVNDPVWHILAPQLAKEGLAAYFDGLAN